MAERILMIDDDGAVLDRLRAASRFVEGWRAQVAALAPAAQKDPMAALHLADTYFQAGRSNDAYDLLGAARRTARPSR